MNRVAVSAAPPVTSGAKEAVSSARAASATRLRLAYLTTEYPKVSHTFIRREIVELERRGHEILRLAIRRSSDALADPADREEAARTIHCLSQPIWTYPWASAEVMLTRPVRWLRALRMTMTMGHRSDRGLLRHCAYLIEAAVLLGVLRKHEIEHVHVHFGTNAAAVARLIRCLGGPTYSMTVHGPIEFDSPRALSLGGKVADASFVAAISDFCSAQVRRWARYEDWEKIHVVRCTVGQDFFSHAERIQQESRTLVCVGRLTASKGQLLLIDAVKQLIEEGIEIRLVLVGDGEMREAIARHIAESGLGRQVQITGWIDEVEVRKHILASRAVVQPSFAEGLPVVIMEAMSLARPVIATRITGIPELVRHGENGWLVTAGNIHELANAMRVAMTTPDEQLNTMGQAGKQAVQRLHDTSTEVSKLEALLRRTRAHREVR